jgi:hypothetical protein
VQKSEPTSFGGELEGSSWIIGQGTRPSCLGSAKKIRQQTLTLDNSTAKGLSADAQTDGVGAEINLGGTRRVKRVLDLKNELSVHDKSQGPDRCLCAWLDVRGEARMVAMRRRKHATLDQLNGVIACRF